MTEPIKTRYEYKYRLSQSSYYRTLNAIKPFCRSDKYSLLNNTGRYLVRSVYYDCYNYSAYTEKMAGVFHRDKFRIRSYDNDIEKASKVRVEIKSRIGYLITKSSDLIDVSDYQAFLDDGTWGKAQGKALEKFSYNYFKYHLKPTVIVEYQREAYFSLVDAEVRFSFDHDVQYAWCSNLFAPDIELKPCLQNSIIFEIKTDRNDIDWVSTIVKEVGLVSEPNSKYANGFEHTANDIYV